MTIQDVATIRFTDHDSGDEAVVIVRRCDDKLSIALSVRGNGDIEVLIDSDTAKRVAEAITQGVGCVGPPKLDNRKGGEENGPK